MGCHRQERISASRLSDIDLKSNLTEALDRHTDYELTVDLVAKGMTLPSGVLLACEDRDAPSLVPSVISSTFGASSVLQ